MAIGGGGTNTAEKPVIKVSKIKISGDSKKVAAGKKVKLTAEVSPSDAVNKSVTWESGNKKVATVNNSGVVTIKKGSGGKTIKLKAKVNNSGKVKKVKITAMATDGSGKKSQRQSR